MKNELLGKLIAQATTREDHYPPGCNGQPEYWYSFNKEKFAELIVKECAVVAHCNFHVDGVTLGGILKEHFGVE